MIYQNNNKSRDKTFSAIAIMTCNCDYCIIKTTLKMNQGKSDAIGS